MRIGIIKTGDVVPALTAEHGEYPDMFVRMLGAVDPGLEFFTVDVVGGDPLPDPHDADGWLVTGSRHGVYDDLPWIEPLKSFLRDALAARVPVVGVCFGHQILAEAMGGKAEKSDKGWALGVQSYETRNAPGWLVRLDRSWTAHAVHQDQVTAQPPDTTVISVSPFCDYAALAYGDAEAPIAISVQPHPECNAAYIEGLIEKRLGAIVPQDVIETARDSLGQPVDNAEWAKIFVQFLRKARAANSARAKAQS